MLRLRAPSPALVVAVIALFVALSGTAVAAGVVPMAKRALFANNAGKLQGKSARQIAAIPGPANSAAELVSTAAAPFALAPSEDKVFSADCQAGATAMSGGYGTPGAVFGADAGPTPDGGGWAIHLVNLSDTASATGTVTAVCLE